jgi:adenylate cyclase
MDLTAHQTKRRNAIIRLILISSFLGFSYTLFAGEWGDIRAMLNGTLIGFFGSIIVSIFEFRIFNPHYRKLSFLAVICLKTLLYFLAFIVIIIGVKGYVDSLFSGIGFWEYLNGEDFRRFIKEEDFKVILSYTFFFLAAITFTIQMSRKIGYSTLLNMITGKYHEPREEDRIFMLIDLKSSVTIAEKFGNLKYHQFLNEFYYVITKCIITAKGNIYRYVGDEIMVSWKLKTGLNNFNCLRTYFYIKSEIRKQREKFLSQFNLVPEYTTCFHEGKVVVGEIGEVKSQVVFSGETLSELQKLKKSSSIFQENLIISETLIKQMDIPAIYVKKELGCITLNKEEKNFKVYSLTEIEP